MAIITVEELKAYLDQLGVDYSKYEENLEQLLTSTISKIMSLTGAPINPVTHEEMVADFSSKMLQLSFYPVCLINTFIIDEKNIQETDYKLDKTLGVIYLNNRLQGFLTIEYTCQVSSNVIDNLVNPLITDMLAHDITKGFSFDGEYSTVKEGDVSISYDTSTGAYSSIQDRLNKLSNMYSIRAKLL